MSPNQRKSRRKSRIINSYDQTIDNKDLALGMLLRGFGKLIPVKGSTISQAGTEHLSERGDKKDWIEVSSICYNTLNRVCSIEIEWVDCLSLHLEFDSQTKTLKLFRFPSLCLLMRCHSDQNLSSNSYSSLMSRYVCSLNQIRPIVIS